MPLIKSSSSAIASARPFSMADIESYARTLLLKARQDADQLLAAAQDEAELLKKTAQIEGLAAGKKEGLIQGKAEGEKVGRADAFDSEKKKLAELLTALQAMLVTLDQERESLTNRAEAEVLPLSLAIANKVTKRMGLLDPRVVEANARESVRLVLSRHDLRIHANPAQRDLMHQIATRLQQQWPQLTHIEVIEDIGITPGGCRISTAGGEIDADLQSQLDRIARELIPEPEPQVNADERG
jgi:flagellar assembly protein FliH